ncbi:BON domain-containing protein [Pseudorhodobacter antarcticus]|uniref:Potassium binding protein Kbp n=1 Tax=Pseudorhodobacter antarcticus TaxID=1077947 RepID=A0A1H8CLG0_9RHOB|nr:peptidoglycan-binding protein LysM [Pseudorhodobacter antarcticus]SEM96111.1 BON domain-containing protein [Pseudorhodobacter antarcticus]
MVVWSFVKDAGTSLFGGKADAADAPKEDALLQEVKSLGLDTTGMDIKVDTAGKVVVTGNAVSQEMKEKVILAVGNVAGVGEVQDDMPDAGPAPVFHEVKKGDTLSAISKATLGSANRYNEIFEANRPMLSHPDKIYPGQMLRIPQA